MLSERGASPEGPPPDNDGVPELHREEHPVVGFKVKTREVYLGELDSYASWLW